MRGYAALAENDYVTKLSLIARRYKSNEQYYKSNSQFAFIDSVLKEQNESLCERTRGVSELLKKYVLRDG